MVVQSISKLAQNMDSALLPCVIAFLPLGCQVVNFVHQLSVSWCQSPTLYLSLITVSENVTWHHQLLPHTLPDTITSFRTLYLTLSSLSPHFNWQYQVSPTIYLTPSSLFPNFTWHHEVSPHTLPDTIKTLHKLFLAPPSLSPHLTGHNQVSPTLCLTPSSLSPHLAWHPHVCSHALPDTIKTLLTLNLAAPSLAPHFN